MALESKLGEAYVEIRARRQKFLADLKQAEADALRRTKTLGGKVGAVLGKLRGNFAALGPLAIAGATTALVHFLRTSIAAADAIGKNSRLLGLQAETFQELEFAASQAGVSQDEFIVGTRNLAKRIAEADSGLETYARSFRALGVNLRDQNGELRTTDDVLYDLADGFKATTSETEKVFHAMNLFGRGGARMVNLLNEGSTGIRTLRSEARRLGIVLDNEMVAQAENAADQIDRLQRVVGVNFRRALLTLTPLVVRFSAAMAELGPAIAGTIERFAPADVAGSKELSRRIEELESPLSGLRKALLATGTLPQAKAFEALRLLFNQLTDGKERLEELRDRAKAGEAAMAAMFAPPPEAGKLAEVLEDLQFQLDQLGRSDFERQVEEQLRKSEGAGRSQIETLVRQIQAQTAINERVAEYKRLLEEATPPLERLHAQISQILADVGAGLISQEDANRVIELLSKEFEERQKALADLADQGKDVFETLGEAVASWGDQFAGEMADALLTGKSTFRGLFLSFYNDFVKQVLAATVFNPLFKALGAALGGLGGPAGTVSTVGSSGIPLAFASGGRMSAGQPGIVGEEGPELFVPSGAGSIVPNGALGGVTVNQQLLIQPGLAGEVRQQIQAMRPLIEQWSKSAVADAARRGGSLASNLRGGRR